MSYDKISRALESVLADITGLNVFYENDARPTPTTEIWCQVEDMPISRRPAALTKDTQWKYTGLFAIDVYAPKHEGPEPVRAVVQDIIDAFPQGFDIQYEDVTVRVQYAERRSMIPNDNYYHIPVVVGYYTYL